MFGIGEPAGKSEQILTTWRQKLPKQLQDLVGAPETWTSQAGKTIGKFPIRNPSPDTAANLCIELDLAATTDPTKLRIPQSNEEKLKFVVESAPEARKARAICHTMASMLKDIQGVAPETISTVGKTVRVYDPQLKRSEAIAHCTEKGNTFQWWEHACRKYFQPADVANAVLALRPPE